MRSRGEVDLWFFRLFLAAVFIGGFASCDSAVSPESGPYDPLPDKKFSLTTAPTADIHNRSHGVRLDSLAKLSQGTWDPGSDIVESVQHIFSAGLWLYAETDKPRAIATFFGETSNYRIAETDEGPAGLFSLTADSLGETFENWPTSLGAPSMEEGEPQMYGDMMGWGFYRSGEPSGDFWDALKDPIIGLDLAISVYAFENISGQNVLFFRYEVVNNTGETINDLYVGFHSDTDLTVRSFESETCRNGSDAGTNATGYDADLGLTYTYNPTNPLSAGACHGVVAGYTFIQTPLAGDLPEQVMAHTIIRKNLRFDFPGFGELDYTAPRHIGLALQGFSTSGTPMIDPTTGLETKFAFAGDPVAGTGWLDTPEDIRSMLSLKPFAIGAGETKTVTVAWIVVAEANLDAGLNRLKSVAASIQNGAQSLTY